MKYNLISCENCCNEEQPEFVLTCYICKLEFCNECSSVINTDEEGYLYCYNCAVNRGEEDYI